MEGRHHPRSALVAIRLSALLLAQIKPALCAVEDCVSLQCVSKPAYWLRCNLQTRTLQVDKLKVSGPVRAARGASRLAYAGHTHARAHRRAM